MFHAQGKLMFTVSNFINTNTSTQLKKICGANERVWFYEILYESYTGRLIHPTLYSVFLLVYGISDGYTYKLI